MRHGSILRQAGSLSSLAISENEQVLEAEDRDLKRLLLQERDLMEKLISSGNTVRCLISPSVQIVNFQLKILSVDHVRSDVLPRLNQLCATLMRHLNNPGLQVSYTARLPHDNVLIDEDGCCVFVGKRRLREWGYRHTTIYHDRVMVRSESDRFDSAFFDAAAACLGEPEVTPDACGCAELKRKVIAYLEFCRTSLINMISAT
jgi:hypothetical protein